MAINKNAPVQALTPSIDPAVAAAMGLPLAMEDDPTTAAMKRMFAARSMTPGKAKKKAKDAARTKVTFDWPSWLIERLEAIAGQEGEKFPLNQLAAVLVVEGLRQVMREELDLEARKIPSRTPAFDIFLRIDEPEDL